MEKDLLAAALAGSLRLLKRALASPNIDVNCVDKDGRTAIFLAAREGKDDIVQSLLDAGANIHLSSNKDRDTPLIIACSEGHTNVAQKLIEAGAKVNGPNAGGWTPLIYAAYYGHKDVVQLLLANNATINQVSNTGCSALYRACTSNRADMALLLVEAGADVNLSTADARSPLGVASWYGYTAVVRVLLEAGAEVDTYNNSGSSPLHEALENEHYEVIELLLSLGQADPTLVTSDGRAPLSLARSERAIGLVSHALQAKQIRDSLRALQQTQPQLTQLTHTVKHGAENSYTVAVEGASSLDSSTDEAVAQVVIDRTSDGIVLANTTDGSKAEKSKQSAVEEEDSSSARRHSARRSAQLSTQVLSTLHSLANASPLTIDCLKRLGASVAQAEQQYDRIRKDPTVYEYYLFFIQSVSSAVLACQTIASGFVDDARVTSAEQIMGGIDMAAQAVSWMGAPLVTGIGKFLLGLANNFDRQRTIRRITTYFPSVDSHKFIEILARELTILLWKDIHAVLRETKKASKLSILNRVMRAVEWMNTSTNLSVVQGFACGHASLLIDTLMRSEQPFVVEYSHLPVLMEWTTGFGKGEIESRRGEQSNSPLLQLDSISNGNLSSFSSSAREDCGAVNTPVAPNNAFAEKEEVDERIFMLQEKLVLEQREREATEKQHKRDIAALQKQMKSLEAVNQIFSGGAAGGLVNAQSAEQAHKALGEHLTQQAQRQDEHAAAIRELALRMELLVEDNNLHSPVRVEVSGGSGGSAVYSSDKEKGPAVAPMGDWVNSKISRTADSLLLTSPPLPPAQSNAVFPALPVKPATGSGGSSFPAKPKGGVHSSKQIDATLSSSVRRESVGDAEFCPIDRADSNAIDNGGCCVLS